MDPQQTTPDGGPRSGENAKTGVHDHTHTNHWIFTITIMFKKGREGLTELTIQRSAKVDAPGCVNAAGKQGQK